MQNEEPDVIRERWEGRILIVDDEKDLVLILVDTLESRGYQVEVAYSAQRGREKVETFDAQVALLDIRLGHESGIDLITELKRACPEILCVMMTAYAAVDTAIEAIHKGAYDYLQKPLDVRYLLATLDRCFEKLRLESEKAAAEEALRARNAELVEMMEALRESEERFRSLVETTSDWIWEVDQYGVYTYASPRVRDLLGCGPEEVIGKTPFDLMPPDEAERVAGSLWDIIESREPFAGLENTNLHRDGRRVVLETSGVPILDANGNLWGYRGIDRDVTARKRAEEEIQRRNEELAALHQETQSAYENLKHAQTQLIQSAKMAAIGELASGVAHELNNPLTSVLGFAELLLRNVVLEEPARRDLNIIVKEAHRARDIVRALLDFARQTEFRREPADVNQVVQETLTLIRRRLERRGIAVKERYAPDLPIALLDTGRMKQVFLNLVVNALDAMPQGGTLTVTSEQVGDDVAVCIADTGVGIPETNLSRIFEPFFTTRPVGQGPGLGLSVSLGIVEQHGGHIEVESQVGQGSTFTVWLPVDTADG